MLHDTKRKQNEKKMKISNNNNNNSNNNNNNGNVKQLHPYFLLYQFTYEPRRNGICLQGLQAKQRKKNTRSLNPSSEACTLIHVGLVLILPKIENAKGTDQTAQASRRLRYLHMQLAVPPRQCSYLLLV